MEMNKFEVVDYIVKLPSRKVLSRCIPKNYVFSVSPVYSPAIIIIILYHILIM